MQYLDFGCEINFQSVKVDPAGRLSMLTREPIGTAPYFQLADRPAGDEGEAQARAQASHFLVRPFPGHEWNHLLVYFLQDPSIQLARMIAHGLGEAPPAELDMHPVPAADSVHKRSLARLEAVHEAYIDIVGRKTATRFAEACRGWMGRGAFVGSWGADEAPPATPAPAPRAPGTQALRQSLDFTYLHLSFAAEAMLLVLDVILLARMGNDPADFVTEQAMQDPLFLRLGSMSAARMTRFLEKWHRQRYAQFDPFTARFVRGLRKLRFRKHAMGAD